MIYELVIVSLAFLLSALYSGAEAAFYATRRLKIEILHRKGIRGAHVLMAYLKAPARFIATILVGNNIANVLFASYVTILLAPAYPEWAITLLTASAILIFGEILPKSILHQLGGAASMRLVRIIRVSEVLFSPVSLFLNKVSHWITRLLKTENAGKTWSFSREDIEHLVKESRYYGHIQRHEEEFLGRIMRLSDTKVRQIMVPRTEMISAPANISIKALRKAFIKSQVSRMPIYKNTIDHIIGVVHALDLLQSRGPLKALLRPVPVVPETRNALLLLRDLRKIHSAVAIVIDEYGGTAGIVSLEDIFEEIFGEIADEYDSETDLIDEIEPGTYHVLAKIDLKTLEQELHIALPEGDYDTLGGFLISQFGYVPPPGETFEHEDAIFSIRHSDRRKVSQVQVTLKKRD